MKQLITGAFCLLTSAFAFSQATYSHGNEWITSGTQGVARIGVEVTGVYRITVADFAAQGINISVIPPDELHLYRRGSEVPIRVEESGGVPTAIEFFGERNDGADEALACRNTTGANVVNPALHFNPRRSTQTDLATYFLVRQASPAARMSEHVDTAYLAHTPLPRLRTQVTEDYLSPEWMPGPVTAIYSAESMGADLGMGEGPKGAEFTTASPVSKSISTPLADGSGSPAEITVRVLSLRTHSHTLQVQVNGGMEVDTSFAGYLLMDFVRPLAPSLPASTTLTCTSLGAASGDGAHTLQSVSVRYDHLPDMAMASQFEVVDFDQVADTYWQLSNALGTAQAWVWDVTLGVRSTATLSAGNLQVIVPGVPVARSLWVVTDAGLLSPATLSPWTVPNLSSLTGAEMVVIPASNMEASANAYQAYRSTTSPRPLSTVVVSLQDIYDEFGYGDISPLAIKRFSHHAATVWATPMEYLLLWGAGTESARGAVPQRVPIYSYPNCDKEYVSNFRTDTVSAFTWAAVGRIPARNDAEAMQFLNKLMAYESTPCSMPFEGVFLGGGNSTTGTVFGDISTSLADSFATSPFMGTSYLYYNDPVFGGIITSAPYTEDSAISRGPVVVELVSLGDGETYDVDFGEPEDHTNIGRFPVIFDLGANGVQVTTDSLRKSQRWLLSDDRGCIAYMGYGGMIFLGPGFSYSTALNHRLFRTHLNRPLGDVLMATDSSMTLLQGRVFNLLGDPAMVMCNPLLAGVSEMELPELMLYPNPAAEAVTLHLQELPAGDMTLTLISATGAVVKAEQAHYPGGTLDLQMQLSSVANGLYLVQVSRNGEMLTRGKLVVQR